LRRTHPQHLGRLHLRDLATIPAPHQALKTHPTYSLVNPCLQGTFYATSCKHTSITSYLRQSCYCRHTRKVVILAGRRTIPIGRLAARGCATELLQRRLSG
jgi:hypothetical protein